MSNPNDDPPPTLLGRPLVITEAASTEGDIVFGPLAGFPYTRTVRVSVPPAPTPPIPFAPRAGLMGGVTLTTENAHELADPACVSCEGSGLRCPEDAESLTGYFEACGLDAGAGWLCACCGCDRADHTYCPVCILKTREQFDTANQ